MKKRSAHDRDEARIVKGLEHGEWKSLGASKVKEMTEAARRQLKQERVNIRLASDILKKLRDTAQEEGIPYQTFIASILYRYVHGRLHDEKHLQEAFRLIKKAA